MEFPSPADIRGAGDSRGPLERHIRRLQEALKLDASRGYRYGGEVRFTASGNFIKANYPGLRAITVEMVGGGSGSGGTAATAAGESAISGAGAGAAYARKFIFVSDLDASEAVTVGQGGAAGASGANAGGNGTDSVFDTISGEVRADGATGGGGGNSVAPVTGVFGAPGSGGLASGSAGDLVITGGDGIAGFALAQNRLFVGVGGASYFSGTQADSQQNTKNAGNAGKLYGGGASSAVAQQSQTAGGGSAGADGIVIVHLWF